MEMLETLFGEAGYEFSFVVNSSTISKDDNESWINVINRNSAYPAVIEYVIETQISEEEMNANFQ